MLISSRAKTHLRVVQPNDSRFEPSVNLESMIDALGIRSSSNDEFIASLPFSLRDSTVGAENELQTAVAGKSEAVDLPIAIRSSSFYKNTVKYASTGDMTHYLHTALERHLNENTKNIWENSWVRFPKRCLTSYAERILRNDLRADKKDQDNMLRRDVTRFFFIINGESYIRIPVSYMLKLALADSVGDDETHPVIRNTAEKLMPHFLNDNTSPEITSFYPAHLTPEGEMGKLAAKETLKRFLLTQLLTQYANKSFHLSETGQQAHVYFAPQPPLAQKNLNNLISDAFYRELFMSPCLSGWNRGEDKHDYMGLCHRVLSLSQLNAVAKLKEAGIVTNNLVILPNTSNISLANNGTHISLGSKKLSQLISSTGNGITSADEKYVGDLAIKIIEHFLPLFVNTYSAAPYRFDFWEFHPEKMLGFLPHELDFTHLRMLWRRWKKKASNQFFGRSLTPFGPEKFDRLLSRILRLKGDYIPDVRLIDYLAALMSTNESPALNGMPESESKLKKDLADMGVFDESMPLYSFYRLRCMEQNGFSGFEGRYYSAFEDIIYDMGHAVNLQNLITALAFKYIFKKKISHEDIPDHPTVESERRQIIFGTAIGIPTFFVKKDTKNKMMRMILKRVKHTRNSRRYKGYIRVLNSEYQKALLSLLDEDAVDLTEMLHQGETLNDLDKRLNNPEIYAASGRLFQNILSEAGAKSPMKMSGKDFNTVSENYYRTELKKKHIESAFDLFLKDVAELDSWQNWRSGYYNKALLTILKGYDATRYLNSIKDDLINETLSESDIIRLIQLLLIIVHKDMHQNAI